MNLESVFGSLRRKYMGQAAGQSPSARSRTRLSLQTLENREVPAVLPAPVIEDGTTRSIPDNASNVNAPSIYVDTAPAVAQDPVNPNFLVAVSVSGKRGNANSTFPDRFFGGLNGGTGVGVTFSSNGGATWTDGFIFEVGIDPAASAFNNQVPYTNVSNPAITFDRFHNAYVTYIERNAASTSGRIVVRKLDMSTGLPTAVSINRMDPFGVDTEATVYSWVGNDVAYNPTILADSNALVGTAAGPTVADNQVDPLAQTSTDPSKVKLFVAWNSVDVPFTNSNNTFIDSTIRMVMSSDGGLSYSPTVVVNGSGNGFGSGRHTSGFVNAEYSAPQLAITAGRSGQGDGTNNAGGQLITSYTNRSDPFFNQVNPNLVTDVMPFGAPNADPSLDRAPKAWEGSNPASMQLDDFGSIFSPQGITDYPISVPAGSGITRLDDLSIRVAMQHNDFSQVSLELISPDGLRVATLFNQRFGGNDPTFVGGALLGVQQSSNSGQTQFAVGTVFSDYAARSILDASAAAPYTGEFRPEDFVPLAGSPNSFNFPGTFSGMTDEEIAGDWILRVTDYAATTFNNVPFRDLPRIENANIRFSQNFTDGLGIDNVPGIGVNGNSPTGTGHPTVTPANPAGVGSGISIAVDNTVGSFSPYQGRVYAAYVTGGNVRVNFSDDGGRRWGTKPVNLGPGFNPKVAVDQTTGTVVVTYYSAAADAALPSGSRSRMMMTTCISGPDFTTNGSPPVDSLEFATPVSVSPSDYAYDQVLGRDVFVENVPSNPAGLGAEAYGNNTGLTVNAGKVTLVYAGNVDRQASSQLRTQSITIASGPRVVGGDTGAILGTAEAFDTRVGGVGFIPYNGPSASGQNRFEKFIVEFDRVIDPATFTAADVKVIYRTPNADPTSDGAQIAVSAVDPLDEVLDPFDGSSYGSKQFIITLTTPQTAAGSYSYVIGNMAGYAAGRFGTTDVNGISDRIPSQTTVLNQLDYMPGPDDYPSAAYTSPSSPVLPMQITDATLIGTFFSTPHSLSLPATPNGEVVGKVTVTINVSHQDLSQLQAYLTSPTGQTVLLFDFTDAIGADLDGTTFDDAANATILDTLDSGPYSGSYKATTTLDAFAGAQVDGLWTLVLTDNVTGIEGTLDSWELHISKAELIQGRKDGNQMDQDGDSTQNESAEDVFSVPEAKNGTPFVLPYVPESLPITVPGPHVIDSRPIARPETDDNVIVNNTGTGLDIAFDRTMNTLTFTPADIVRLVGPAGDLPLTGITITPITDIGGAVTTGNSRFYRITIPTQSLPGQYQIQLSSDIADTTGTKIDKDGNAGVGTLLGLSANPAAMDEKAYGPATTSVAVPARSTATAVVSINGDDDGYLLQKLTAIVSMTVPGGDLRNIEARLVSPDNSISVLLFQDILGQGTTFNNVTFTDDAVTPVGVTVVPVQSGFVSNKFNNPITRLSALNGVLAKGDWKLVIRNKGDVTAVVNRFGLTFGKPQQGAGVGDAVADQTSLSFRIFQADASTATAKNNWNPIGPDGRTTEYGTDTTVGRVSSLQVDPSDPSGNIVYAAGASGGLWRTTNFMTRDPAGPVWVPLTDFGANQIIRDAFGNVIRYGSSINVGSIALFNLTDKPDQTKILIGTGSEAFNLRDFGQDGNRYDGVGFLYSEDAGKTWQVLDSVSNFNTATGKFSTAADPARNHQFVGSVVLKVMFEKKVVKDTLTPVMYAVVGRGSTPLADNTAGLWRSTNGGRDWVQLFQGDTTDFVIGEGSAQGNTGQRPTIGYLGVRGTGVMVTSNLNSTNPNFILTNGLLGRPTVRHFDFATNPVDGTPVITNAPVDVPNGAKGRIALVSPQYIYGNSLANTYYKDWVVAAVAAPNGRFDGLYVSKDAGANWTKINLTRSQGFRDGDPDIETLNGLFNNYFSGSDADTTLSLAMDPQNPNIVFVGADRIIKVDMTLVNDPYKLQLYSHSDASGGLYNTTTNANADRANGAGGGLDAIDFTRGLPLLNSLTPVNNAYDLALGADRRRKWNFLNLVRDPYQPFLTDTTLFTQNVVDFQNNGNEVTWLEPEVEDVFSSLVEIEEGGDYDSVSGLFAYVDPLTGKTRVTWGHDDGIGTFVSNADGRLDRQDGFYQPEVGLRDGTDLQVTGSRNGNLSLARFYSGDAQPSLLAASIAESLLVGAGRRLGDVFVSNEGVLGTGDASFSNIGRDGLANYVATDKTGSGRVYILRNFDQLFNAGDVATDFFQVQLNGNSAPVSRTLGLFQNLADSNGTGQWDFTVRRFAVNPIDGDAIAMSSRVGRIFATTNTGLNWTPIAEPAQLDGTYVPAIAYGAPRVQPANEAPVDLNEYIYAGTTGGRVFVRSSTTAGAWRNISGPGGLDGTPVQKIIASPGRGTNSAYAVTLDGVYYMADWTSTNPALNTWQNISGNLFTLTQQAFKLGADFTVPVLNQISSLAVDWRSAVPVLYVGGDSGVFRSADRGASWARFGNTPTGGGLPLVKVTDLDLALGDTQSDSGNTDPSGAPNILVATTLGRGMWTIALGSPAGVTGPKVIPESTTPIAPITGTFDSFTITFDDYIDSSSFTEADVTVVGPRGNVIPTSEINVFDITPSNPTTGKNLHNQYLISFDTPLRDDGTYTITVGPNISNGSGLVMNQDGDKNNGEAVTTKSAGDAYRFNVVLGNNDLTDFVNDSYVELLGRLPTNVEYLSKITALEKARLTGLSVVVRELLSGYSPAIPATPTTPAVPASYGDETARIQSIRRLFKGAGANQIGDFLPALDDAEVAARADVLVAAIKAGTKSPESAVIEILSGIDYFESAPVSNNPDEYLRKLYADLFKGLDINPGLEINPTTYATQRNQALTPTGRKALVTSLVNGGSVQYTDGVWSAAAPKKTTNYRNHFITLAYQDVFGPVRVVTSSEMTAARSAMARALKKDTLAGSENVFAIIFSSKEYFDTKTQLEPAQPVGEPADNGLHSNRAWAEGLIADRYYGRTPDLVTGLYSTNAERSYFSQKVLDSFKTVRQTFLRSLTTTVDYKRGQANKYFQLVHGPARSLSDQEMAAAVKFATIPNLIASRFATLETDTFGNPGFASKVFPQPNGFQTMYSVTNTDPATVTGTAAEIKVKESIIWAKAVYKILFGITLTNESVGSPLEFLASYSRSAGRTNAALAVLNGVDGTPATVANSTKFKPTIGPGGTYRELLIKEYYNDILDRDPTGPFSDPSSELGRSLTFLRTNRWEYLQAELMLNREFYEVVS